MNNSPRHAPSMDLPLRYFVAALLALTLAGATLPIFAGDVIAQHHYTHRTIAFTHLITLGWITMIILGATIQMVPVALGVAIHSERLARWTFWLYLSGTAGMVACFWTWHLRGLVWFGTLVLVGLVLFVYNVGRTLGKAGLRDPVAGHMAMALGYLVLTFLAGQYLMHDKLFAFSPFHVLHGIHAHAHLAFLGWFLMMIVGVSYRMAPMFLLSTVQSMRRIGWCFGLLNAGIIGVFTGILLDQPWLPAATLVVIVALGIWIIELRAILKAGTRPALDGSLRLAQRAVLHLPVIAVIGLWQSFPDTGRSMFGALSQTGYGVLALFGFVTLFLMGMLYKIIPFLVWYRLYPSKVGREPVPQIHELYSVRMQTWGGWIFMTGVWLVAMAASVGEWIPLWTVRLAAAWMGIGIVLFTINLALPLIRLVHEQGCPLSRLLGWWLRCKAVGHGFWHQHNILP